METITHQFRLLKENRMVQWLLFAALFSISGWILGRYAMNPGKIRILFFAVLLLGLTAFSLRKPIVMMYAVIWYLPFLGFFRRLLIPVSGWNSFDPLVILAPLATLLLGSYWVHRTYVRHELIEDDTKLFKLVRIMLLIDLIEVVNPLQGGILAGFGGIMFYMVPLFWMVLGRLYMTERWAKIIYSTVLLIAILSALYGIKQMIFGFFNFEVAWIYLAGYSALMVGDGSRPFSFFTNAAEYTNYLAIAINIAWIAVLRGRVWQKVFAILAIPLLFYALFMASSRTPFILTSLGIGITTIIHAKKGAGRKLVTMVMLLMLVVSYFGITKIESSNALISHQVNGITNPLDEEHSTLHIHWSMFVYGMTRGFINPIGRGLGSTTLAAAKMADSGENSEVDISNMMMSNGLAGGIVYILIVIEVIRRALQNGHSRTFALLALGIVISTLGNWSNGGNYSTSSLIWLTIGYMDRITIQRRREANS